MAKAQRKAKRKNAVSRMRKHNSPVAETVDVAALELVGGEVSELVDLLGVGDLAALELLVVLSDLLDVGGVDTTAEDELLLGLVSLGVLALELREAHLSGTDAGKGGNCDRLHLVLGEEVDSLSVCRTRQEKRRC
jgi:hypothetical protein